MPSVVAEPETKYNSATLGISSISLVVTSRGNASAVSPGGVDVAAKLVARRRSATPTSPGILPTLLVGQGGGVGAVAEVEQADSSAASTPSIPSAVGVATNIAGTRHPATPTSLIALFISAAVDVVAKFERESSSATPTSAPIAAAFAVDAKCRSASSSSLCLIVEAHILLPFTCLLAPSLPRRRWEDTQAWVGKQFPPVSGQAGSLGHCHTRGGRSTSMGHVPAARICSMWLPAMPSMTTP